MEAIPYLLISRTFTLTAKTIKNGMKNIFEQNTFHLYLQNTFHLHICKRTFTLYYITISRTNIKTTTLSSIFKPLKKGKILQSGKGVLTIFPNRYNFLRGSIFLSSSRKSFSKEIVQNGVQKYFIYLRQKNCRLFVVVVLLQYIQC